MNTWNMECVQIFKLSWKIFALSVKHLYRTVVSVLYSNMPHRMAFWKYLVSDVQFGVFLGKIDIYSLRIVIVIEQIGIDMAGGFPFTYTINVFHQWGWWSVLVIIIYFSVMNKRSLVFLGTFFSISIKLKYCWKKNEKQKYNTIRAVPKSNRKKMNVT